MRLILCAAALALSFPAVAQEAIKAKPPGTVTTTVKPPNKALLLQLDGLTRQKMTAEANVTKLDKQIAALQAKKTASGELSPADMRKLQDAMNQRNKSQILISDLVKKIADTQQAILQSQKG